MQKTSVYLNADEAARIAMLADREGTSQAEVIRRAIRSYEPSVGGDRNFALVGSGEGPGDSVADYTEEELLDGFGA
ncbi:MAG TPA: CopG family transcriptional regulator [Mycobacterium sp.]|nr:CopG family transcriptional regulator [Mycobacterium sp.]